MGMIHATKSGSVEFLERYGNGKNPSKNYAQMPGVLTAQDDDGHIEAWRVDGSMRDAAEVVGRFFRLDGKVAVYQGTSVWVENAPDDFWTDDGDAKRAAYPDVVAW